MCLERYWPALMTGPSMSISFVWLWWCTPLHKAFSLFTKSVFTFTPEKAGFSGQRAVHFVLSLFDTSFDTRVYELA